MKLKKCKFCKIEFIPHANNQKFHSKECTTEHYKPIMNKKHNAVNKIVYKKIKIVVIKRNCLKCLKIFKADGLLNRICVPCARKIDCL